MSDNGSAADDIKVRLITAGLVIDPDDGENGLKDWVVNVGQMPAEPDNVVTLLDYGLKNPEQHMNMTQCEDEGLPVEVEYKGVQVKVRSTDYLTAYKKLEEIRLNLKNTGNFDSEDGVYQYNVLQKTPVIPLGEDETNNREIISVSFQATRTKN